MKFINNYVEDTDICSEVYMDMFITFGAIIDNSDNNCGSETNEESLTLQEKLEIY